MGRQAVSQFHCQGRAFCTQPCDQGIIRAFKAHYRREIRERSIAELDDIQNQSDASAVAKMISLLDALHMVAMSWKRVSEKTIENCFRKGGFSKTNAETPASEESDLTSEIFDQAPDGLSKEEFENWLEGCILLWDQNF